MHNVILKEECLSGECSRTLLAILKFDNENSILPLLVNTHRVDTIRNFVDTIKSQDFTRYILIDLSCKSNCLMGKYYCLDLFLL